VELENSALGFAMTLVHDREQAEEIVQEAFANVWAARNTPQERAEFKRWLYKAILNLARDQARHRTRWSLLRWWAPAPSDPFDEVERRADDAALACAGSIRGSERRSTSGISKTDHSPKPPPPWACARTPLGSLSIERWPSCAARWRQA
jgi:DNA-directed RNA polymerase specialized sigma24 family protein